MNHHIIPLDEKIDKRRGNAKACEVALTRIRDILIIWLKKGLNVLVVPNLSLTFQRSRAQG